MLSIGWNRKLSKGRIGVFNLPASRGVCGVVCPGCYAKRAQIYPVVRRFRGRNLRAARRPDFADKMVAEIRAARDQVSAIRVHESGDFISQQYVDAWAAIARQLPGVQFYAYTKKLRRLDFHSLLRRKNFVLIDSLKYGINYGDQSVVDRWVGHGAFVCPSTKGGITCGAGCSYCLTKSAQRTGVVFRRH